MSSTKPSLELLRQLSDEHVLTALMEHGRSTRAELATRTGISKPTVGESVRRLAAAGVVVDTGHRTSGPGRIGSYYDLSAGVGWALAVGIAPDGVVAEIVDARAAVIARTVRPLTRVVPPDEVATVLAAAVRDVSAAVPGPIRLAVVSAADPVQRDTGRLLHLPDAPFLLGELSPVEVLADLVDGPVLVDNDVHWAARAERAARPDEPGLDDFVYLYLGAGLGCAVVSDGAVRRGQRGIAGEIAHVITRGPHGRAMAFIDVFGELGLRQPRSTAIDVDALLTAVTGPGNAARSVRATVASAVADVIAAMIALADPAVVVLGGQWGTEPVVLDAIRDGCDRLARSVPIGTAAVVADAPLTGARNDAVSRLRRTITEYRVRPVGPGRVSPCTGDGDLDVADLDHHGSGGSAGWNG